MAIDQAISLKFSVHSEDAVNIAALGDQDYKITQFEINKRNSSQEQSSYDVLEQTKIGKLNPAKRSKKNMPNNILYRRAFEQAKISK